MGGGGVTHYRVINTHVEERNKNYWGWDMAAMENVREEFHVSLPEFGSMRNCVEKKIWSQAAVLYLDLYGIKPMGLRRTCVWINHPRNGLFSNVSFLLWKRSVDFQGNKCPFLFACVLCMKHFYNLCCLKDRGRVGGGRDDDTTIHMDLEVFLIVCTSRKRNASGAAGETESVVPQGEILQTSSKKAWKLRLD